MICARSVDGDLADDLIGRPYTLYYYWVLLD